MNNSGKSNIFASLKLSHKFAIFGILSIISSILLFYFFWSYQNAAINSAKDRITGVEYATQVIVAMNGIAKHRGMSAALFSGDNSFAFLKKEALLEASAALQKVTTTTATQGKTLNLNKKWANLISDWNSFLGKAENLSPQQNFQRHSDFIARIKSFLIEIDERSRLTFSTNITASYSARIIIDQLPSNLESLGKIRGKISALAAQKADIPTADYAFVSELLHHVEAYNNEIHHSLDVIKVLSPQIADHLTESATKFFNNSNAFIHLVTTKVLQPDLITVPASTIFQAGTNAIQSAEQMEKVLIQELHTILESRITSLKLKTYGILTGMILLLVLAWVSGILILRSMLKRLQFSEKVFEEIEHGNYDNRIKITGNDEIDSLLQKLSSMQGQLQNSRQKEQEKNAEIAQIKTALDRTTTNIMLTNEKGKIIYINDAFRTNFYHLQQEIQAGIPQFNVATLVGSQLGSFNLDGFNNQALMNLNQTVEKDIKIGSLDFYYTMNPIFNNQKEKTGIVIEWTDKTKQVGMQNEINNIVFQAKCGNLDHRMKLANQTGFFKNVGTGINDLIGINESFISETGRIMAALSEGDLSETMEGEYAGEFDSLKDNINKTIFKLRDVISNIKVSAEEVRMDAAQIQNGNDNLKLRTNQQASSLEQSASSMEEITGTVKNSSVNAHEANEMSTLAQEKAEKSGQYAHKTIEAMNEICASSKNISDITGVIDEIAFQTNLLALNAAVEAAHAGDQGKGFAVVASEVRELAQRSSEAAHKIKDLITDSNNKVQVGTELVKNSGEVLQEIITDVASISHRISEIAAAGDEQATGVEMINRSISQIDAVTQQNTDLVKQTASSSEHLNTQASRLVDLVGFFSTDGKPENWKSQNVFDINAA